MFFSFAVNSSVQDDEIVDEPATVSTPVLADDIVEEECLSGAEKEMSELKSTQDQLAAAIKTKCLAEKELLKAEKEKVSSHLS